MQKANNARLMEQVGSQYVKSYAAATAWGNVASMYLSLPMLRGFWPMGAVDDTGAVVDASGMANLLTYAGNPTYDWQGLVPYVDLDGTGDYLWGADNATLDILGTEAFVANPGLTLGGWFYIDAATSSGPLFCKWGAAGSYSYLLQVVKSAPNYSAQFYVSVDGTAVVNVAQTTLQELDTWAFIACRFTPSTELKIRTNMVVKENVAAIPAGIFGSNANLTIGTDTPAATFRTGKVAYPFVCAAAISDTIIAALFHHTRALFGV